MSPEARERKRQYDRFAERKRRRGVRTLDRHLPGWRGRINPATLDMEDHRRCLLGQLFRGGGEEVSGYRRGLFELSEADSWRGAFEWAVAEGFDVDLDRDERYDLLTLVWRHELVRPFPTN